MKWFKRGAIFVAMCFGLLVVIALVARAQVTHSWPEGAVAVEVPPSAWPVDPTGAAKLQALRKAAKSLGKLKLLSEYTTPSGRSITDAEGPLPAGPPPGGWPSHPEIDRLFDAVAALRGLDVPPVRPDADFDLLPLMNSARLRQLRAMEHFLAGRHTEAGQDLATLIRFGQVIQHGGGGLVPPVIGLAIEDAGLRRFEQMREAAPQAVGLREAVRPVLVGASWPSVVARGYAQDCTMTELLFRDLGKLSYTELMASSRDADWETAISDSSDDSAPGWVYDWEKTAALANQRCNAVVAVLLSHPRTWPEFEKLSADGLTRLGAYFDNPVGRILLDIAIPVIRPYAEREDAVRARALEILKSL